MKLRRKLLPQIAALALGAMLVCMPGIAQADEFEIFLDDPLEDESFASNDTLFSENASEAALSELNVDYHTQEEIKDYFKASGLNLYQPIAYNEGREPTASLPYNDDTDIGRPTDEVWNQALKLVNFYRYTAGLDYTVEENSYYTAVCQVGSWIMAANGLLSHYPAQPAGMGSSLYEEGAWGCSHSNLSYEFNSTTEHSLQDSIIRCMDDGDSNNIARVGHRRWILNPQMGETGFGAVTSSSDTEFYSAMFAHDSSNSSATQTMVAWPAQNTPLELLENDNPPWSISFNTAILENFVKIQVKSVSTGQIWNFSSESADGEFYVSNAGYGVLNGCAIFRPNNIDISDGQSYDVTVTGVQTPIQYRVSFFHIAEPLSSISINDISWEDDEYGCLEPRPSATVTCGSKILTEGIDYILEAYATRDTVVVTAYGRNGYRGEVSATVALKNPNNSNINKGAWVRDVTGWWYRYDDGSYPWVDWRLIDGAWYYFNIRGYMQTGWLKYNDLWYYLKPSGAMATGWANVGGVWYYLNASGAMQTGWQKVGGNWYYLNSSGAMKTGWYKVGGNWYYSNASGVVQSNKWIGNYYVTDSGAMATNTWIGKYHVNASGLWDKTS